MNYKDFNLGDWIGHISGVIEDETTLDGNEMRDLVEFLTTLQQEPCDKCVYSTSEGCQYDDITETIPPFEDCISRQAVLDVTWEEPSYTDALNVLTEVRDKVKALPPVNPQKQKSEWQQDHEILKAYSDGANEVLDKIRAEIKELAKPNEFGGRGNGKSVRYGLCKALEIIDKYKPEVGETE